MNIVALKGNLATDLELRYTPTGKAITSGLLAVNKYHPKDKPITDEQKERETVFMPFSIWGEHQGKKGEVCFIYGELRQYTDKVCGKKHTAVECSEMVMHGKRVASPESVKQELDNLSKQDETTNDDDIPFS